MCLDARPGGRLGRRAFLAGGAATVACSALAARSPAAAAPALDPVEVAPGLVVLRRGSWGADLPAPGDLPTEAGGDVRVLVVHHSASANGYAEADVAGTIRQFHAMHTGPERGWPDVAYNFFVDRFGRVWEGRAGSLDRPVIGDATGGNQGFSQLVCLVGNHVAEPPSGEAVDALSRVLAWLARREGVDVTPGAVATFTSRGSNLWPAGATVRTPTIAGHRDLSRTACPGDAAYARVTGDLPSLVAQRVAEQEAAERPATTVPTTPPTSATASTPASSAPPTEAGGDAVAAPARGGSGHDRGGGSPFRAPFLAAGTALTAVAVAMARRQRRTGTATGAPASASAPAGPEPDDPAAVRGSRRAAR
ncbi:MAG TPA: N-acetylmuramoyl-L-alanine amidase [Acidimicrobiales bacterium]